MYSESAELYAPHAGRCGASHAMASLVAPGGFPRSNYRFDLFPLLMTTLSRQSPCQPQGSDTTPSSPIWKSIITDARLRETGKRARRR